MKDLDEASIIKDLKINAHGVGIPSGAAEIFAEHALAGAKKTLKNKSIITEKDLERAITKELKKYNQDLAYVYQNRDTII